MLRLLACLVVALCGITACSSGGGGNKTVEKSQSCPLIAELDKITTDVEHADVADPVVFKETLDDAVTRYVSTVDQLKRVAPSSLRGDLDKVAASVHQYRFQEAATERASLDTYAASECGRTAPPLTTTTTTTTATTTPTSESIETTTTAGASETSTSTP